MINREFPLHPCTCPFDFFNDYKDTYAWLAKSTGNRLAEILEERHMVWTARREVNFIHTCLGSIEADSCMTDRFGVPLKWRIKCRVKPDDKDWSTKSRKDYMYSVEFSEFALQNFLESNEMIKNLRDAVVAIEKAESKISAELSGRDFTPSVINQ